MRRISAVSFLVVAMAAAPLALAAGHATKVGVMDSQSVLQQSKAGQEVKQQIEAYGKQLQSKMGPEQDKLRKEQQVLRRNAKIESKAEQKKAQKTFQAHVQAYQKEAQQAQQSFQEKRLSLMIPLRAKLKAVVESYAKEHGFGMILDDSNVIYNEPSLDVSDAVLKAFNKAQPHAPAPDTKSAAAAMSLNGSGN